MGINSGNPIASFILGGVDNANVSFNNVDTLYARGKLWALHAGDTWKATNKLSVTYGMRWDVSTPSVERYDNMSFLDPDRAQSGRGRHCRARLAFAGKQVGRCQLWSRHPEKTYYHAFSPRLGIAYSLSPKTVIRSGYGIFYSQAFYPGWNGGVAQDGFNTTQLFRAARAA